MIAAVASIFITPWNLYRNPEVIRYTLDILGAFIGPLFGILIADFFVLRGRTIVVDDLYTLERSGCYFYWKGVNPIAVAALIPSALVPALFVVIPTFASVANFTWFVGVAMGFVLYLALSSLRPKPAMPTRPPQGGDRRSS
jgi:NCS1 family nucleobase:cation symporter-1